MSSDNSDNDVYDDDNDSDESFEERLLDSVTPRTLIIVSRISNDLFTGQCI